MLNKIQNGKTNRRITERTCKMQEVKNSFYNICYYGACGKLIQYVVLIQYEHLLSKLS